MTAPRRIGEVLLMQETVDAWVLTQTLKLHTPQHRLISLLIGRAQLDSDDGAMALSEQLGYPAALQRHLERRDARCESLIPRELVQRWVVLPLGRARDGRLAVVARDPTPILQAALEHASKLPVALAVAPALHLEKLIRSVYGLPEDVDPMPFAPPMLNEIGISIDGVPGATIRRSRTISAVLNDGTPELEQRMPQGTDRIDSTLFEIDKAITIAAAERIAFTYAARRWRAALLLEVADGVAIGRRGQGPRLTTVEAIMLPLATPSIVQVAHDDVNATSTAPPSVVQMRLNYLLDDAIASTAAAIVVRGSVRGVLVVGDPLHGGARESVTDLARLVDALSGARERFARS